MLPGHHHLRQRNAARSAARELRAQAARRGRSWPKGHLIVAALTIIQTDEAPRGANRRGFGVHVIWTTRKYDDENNSNTSCRTINPHT